MFAKFQEKSMLKSHFSAVEPSATLVINERSSQLIKAGKEVYRLGFGQSPFPVPEIVVAELRKHANEKDYLPVLGLFDLRQAVAEHSVRTLGISANATQVMIGPGSKELIFGVQMALDCDLLLPSPSWVSYEPQASLVGKKTIWLPTTEDEDWLLSPEVLDVFCEENPNAKLLILNYPNNPTGGSFSVSQLMGLTKILRKHKIIVIADEIYSEINHHGTHESLAKFFPEGTIVSSGLSKWAGAGGWRLGTFIFPDNLSWLRDAMAIIASETFSAVSAPIQFAAVKAYESSEEIATYLRRSRGILKLVGDYVHQKLITSKITCPPPVGGFYLFPNFENFRSHLNNKGIKTSSQFCEILLDETGVALLPGSVFGRPKEELTARLAYVDFVGDEVLSQFDDHCQEANFVKLFCPKIYAAINKLVTFFE